MKMNRKMSLPPVPFFALVFASKFTLPHSNYRFFYTATELHTVATLGHR